MEVKLKTRKRHLGYFGLFSNFLQAFVTYFDAWEGDCRSWEVTNTLLSKQRRLSSISNEAFDDMALTFGNWKKNKSKKKGVCWLCGQLGHFKRNYQKINRVSLVSGSKSIYEDTDSIVNRKSFIIVRDDGPL